MAAALDLIPMARWPAPLPRGKPGAASQSPSRWMAATLVWRSNCPGSRCSTATGISWGYRGFGVCRDTTRIAELERTARPKTSEAPAVGPPVFPRRAPRAATADQCRAASTVRGRREGTGAGRAKRTATCRPSYRPRTVGAKIPRIKIAQPPAPSARQPIAKPTTAPASAHRLSDQRSILERLPVGVLIHRHDKLIYANRAFLEWTGYGDLTRWPQAGGLDALWSIRARRAPARSNGTARPSPSRPTGGPLPARAGSTPCHGTARAR